MMRFRDHAAVEQHIAGPEEIERMAAGIEDVRVNPASLEPQPGIVLTGDAGGDPFLASPTSLQ
jgi:flavin-dependent dehydrogenase